VRPLFRGSAKSERQGQKCQKSIDGAFGTFGPPSVSVFGKITPLVWERRDECPGAVPVIACHDEVVVECDADKAANAKVWLEKAMIDGMDAVVNDMEPHILIEVEASISKTWSG
jgi:hypothetical protein